MCKFWAEQLAQGSNAGLSTWCPSSENKGFMTILTRLEQWREQGAISPEQQRPPGRPFAWRALLAFS